MGFGDNVITTSIVKRAYQIHKKPVVVGDGVQPYWSEVFENNPKISKEAYPGCVWVPSIMGFRPYIDYARSTDKRIAFNDYKVEPGELYIDPKELWDEEGFIYIEPNTKGSFGNNKDWGFEKWQAVVNLLPYRFIQGPGRKLDGVEQRFPKSFRDACALLSKADFFVGTDGGLHHAAAALGKRAVVVWGGLASPRNLGYDTHINLHSGVKPCGSRNPCPHCKKALDWVTVEMVVEAIESRHLSRGSQGSLGSPEKPLQDPVRELPQAVSQA